MLVVSNDSVVFQMLFYFCKYTQVAVFDLSLHSTGNFFSPRSKHSCASFETSPLLQQVVLSAREDVLACECEFSAVHNSLSHAAKVRCGGSRRERLRAGPRVKGGREYRRSTGSGRFA